MQCSFCPVVESDKKIMSLVEFESTLRQASPLAKEVCLHLMGEPLAHPQFKGILDLCEKYKTKVQLTTNGLLLGRYAPLLLKSSILRQINFSLQAFTDNFPEKNLSEFMDPILNFAKDACEQKPELYVNFRLWNQDSLDSDNSNFFEIFEYFFQININRNIEVGAIKSKKIYKRIYLHFDSRFEWPSMELDFQGDQGKCHALSKHIAIHANGDVSPCCLDKEAVINLGNCHDNSLDSILSSDRASLMRKGFENGRLVESLCQHCSYINRFKK